MNETAIEWTDATWNPNSGCEVVSSGCKFCYAMTLAEQKRGTSAFPNGFELTIRPHKLREPFVLKQPSMIFVNSMSDLFWEKIDDDYRDRILDVIEATSQHEYQVLTKRPENMLRYSRRRRLPRNFWAGVTIESATYLPRLDVLREVEASVRFISAEPLLSAFGRFNLDGIHWVITGGESGLHLADPRVRANRALVEKLDEGGWRPREDRVAWVREIRDQCTAAGVALFHKQWGGLRPKSGGAELDGRAWKQYPRMPAAGMDGDERTNAEHRYRSWQRAQLSAAPAMMAAK